MQWAKNGCSLSELTTKNRLSSIGSITLKRQGKAQHIFEQYFETPHVFQDTQMENDQVEAGGGGKKLLQGQNKKVQQFLSTHRLTVLMHRQNFQEYVSG